ncbi:hypothetical protein B0H11DRAFT_1970350 [Mycena galericulata]|nr:hypothetical protein B0H11DRAFT_1970350 [Mycena galericulata]
MGRNETPKEKAAAAYSPSRATREGRVNAARVKTEREESRVPTASELNLETLKGDAPPYEVPSSISIDDLEETIFFNTYDENAKYGSDIYKCDLKRKIWKNITKDIHYLPPPIGSPERKRQLPSRFGGAMAFYKSKLGQRILLLFGGQINGTNKDDLGEVSNELIAVDVDKLRWWVVDVAGGVVAARCESQLVVVDNQFFIFGGKTYIDGQFHRMESYCIATLKNNQWTWDVRDAPYPAHVPPLGSCDATTILDGESPKILLTVGCFRAIANYKDNMTVDLLPRSFVLFDIGLRTFTPQVQDAGTFPGRVGWYDMYNLPRSLKADAASTSAVICTFHAEALQQVPEMWIYSLSSQAGCRPLGLRKHIAAKKRTFELFAVVGEDMYLFGWKKNKWDILVKIPRSVIEVRS